MTVKDGKTDARVFLDKKALGIAETNDCTVFAFATATGISYAEAHLIATQAGRRAKKGMHSRDLISYAMEHHGFKFRKVELVYNGDYVTKMTAGCFARTIGRKGRFYVRKVRHAFNIVNGQIFNQKSHRVFVTDAWEYLGREESEF